MLENEPLRSLTPENRHQLLLDSITDYAIYLLDTEDVVTSWELSVSQPALGQQIKQLEEILSCELFTRHPRGVAITEPGRILHEGATKAIDAPEVATTKLDGLSRQAKSHVRLGVTTSVGKALIGELLKEESSKPSAKISYSFFEGMSDQLASQIDREELDAALAYDAPSLFDRVDAVPLFNEKFVLIGSADRLARRGKVRLSELWKFPLVVGPPDQHYRRYLEQIASKHGSKISVGAEIGSVSLRHETLRHGFFIIGPYGRFQTEDNRDLVALEFEPALIRTMCLIFSVGTGAALRRRIIASVSRVVENRIKDGKLGWLSLPS
ncbi:LysR family transcriptional regulator [Roseiarcaceae bacterium H3SJ34-1]|uniref:LysR family transcriptional regulator n=1 Tax=Terripilifer ovatus TaxID=3032367 RepID=UPI003AB9357C|nr:LysR family transcriptional regulator [Roseiarcaceae bacterium H3SJ34-1]